MSVNYKIGEQDTRPWGTWQTIDVGENYVVKRITVNPNGKLSLQKHQFRSEHWIISEGTALVTLDSLTRPYKANSHIYIQKGQVHRIENKEKTPLIFIEIQTGEILDENDIQRLEDIYNRI